MSILLLWTGALLLRALTLMVHGGILELAMGYLAEEKDVGL